MLETSPTHAANLFKLQMTMLSFHGPNTGHAGRRADFLAGTKSLVTSEHPGGVEMTSEEEEDSDDPAPSNIRQVSEPLNYGSIVI